ncbi:hypothetical protein L2E82_37228 [Cichorium intybus]|uniref:Uncharacterized protein n=1 Tax=Cichorium intybus TaxID=13427 RepID=A0ACB9ADP9_CICIN|nr:hypothetical protein L2E82_37228 [Cichorium intybus]
MASSDEEGEIVPVCVSNYQFLNYRDAPISFSELPLLWSDQENLIENADSPLVFLRGTTDEGLQSYDVVEPIEKYLSAHLPLIQSAVAKDKGLAKSKYLKKFLMEVENPGRREYHLEGNQTKDKDNFIVSDSDEENDDESDDEEELLYDSVCAFCDNGGDILPCEGKCMRSFHPTIDAGEDTSCQSLGFENAAQYEAIPTFLCGNCKHQKHQCFVCGILGCSDMSSTVEVFPCVSATCGHFYHPGCVSKLLYPSNETLAKKLETQIAAGESFTCPIHKCRHCNLGEDKDVHDLQFAVCRRCPKAYHRKCLPRKIAFSPSADGTIKQRAWDGLLPKRILMYCMKHAILPDLCTPKRDHLLFPRIIRKRNQEGSRLVKKTERSKAFGTLTNTDTVNIPKVVVRKSSTMQEKKPSIEKNAPISKNPEQSSTIVQSKSAYKDIQREQHFTCKPVKKIIVDTHTPPLLDTEMKTRICKIINDSTSSFDVEEFMKEKRRRCTHQIYAPQTGLDKTITMGKVEASVMAVRTASKKLEDGGTVEDAKAICEPNVLNQLAKWKKKLHIFLAPFLHGARYTSFGRHFTKADKLKEIVNRLHWYVKDGDTIVDFCCGSNDFSCFMKEKLDSTGKKCLFKNYDLITPKNTFNFEKRDWFSVPLEDLPDGSRLVMGLNPPFGVQASLANKFISHALKFKPKLLILIVPRETKRLDQKWPPYDLIWEEEDMLSGKSFYLPGSVSVQDQPLDDWNVVSPPLSLWSRPDWTSEHKSIAHKQTHIKQNQNIQKQVDKTRVSNYLMEEKHDCYDDFSTIMTKYPDISNILDDVPEGSDALGSTGTHFDDLSDMDLGSPLVSPTNSISGPPCGPYPGFGPPQYGNTSLPYESCIGFQNGFPSHPGSSSSTSHYGQGDFAIQPPIYGQPHYESETNIWPQSTFPPDRRFS